MRAGKGLMRPGSQEHATRESLISSRSAAEVPLAGLLFGPAYSGNSRVER
jgi:hypothetical protein